MGWGDIHALVTRGQGGDVHVYVVTKGAVCA